ncbi:hypothetical protein QOT17_012824 [Balamuthia mandrillaris]
MMMEEEAQVAERKARGGGGAVGGLQSSSEADKFIPVPTAKFRSLARSPEEEELEFQEQLRQAEQGKAILKEPSAAATAPTVELKREPEAEPHYEEKLREQKEEIHRATQRKEKEVMETKEAERGLEAQKRAPPALVQQIEKTPAEQLPLHEKAGASHEGYAYEEAGREDVPRVRTYDMPSRPITTFSSVDYVEGDRYEHIKAEVKPEKPTVISREVQTIGEVKEREEEPILEKTQPKKRVPTTIEETLVLEAKAGPSSEAEAVVAEKEVKARGESLEEPRVVTRDSAEQIAPVAVITEKRIVVEEEEELEEEEVIEERVVEEKVKVEKDIVSEAPKAEEVTTLKKEKEVIHHETAREEVGIPKPPRLPSDHELSQHPALYPEVMMKSIRTPEDLNAAGMQLILFGNRISSEAARHYEECELSRMTHHHSDIGLVASSGGSRARSSTLTTGDKVSASEARYWAKDALALEKYGRKLALQGALLRRLSGRIGERLILGGEGEIPFQEKAVKKKKTKKTKVMKEEVVEGPEKLKEVEKHPHRESIVKQHLIFLMDMSEVHLMSMHDFHEVGDEVERMGEHLLFQAKEYNLDMASGEAGTRQRRIQQEQDKIMDIGDIIRKIGMKIMNVASAYEGRAILKEEVLSDFKPIRSPVDLREAGEELLTMADYLAEEIALLNPKSTFTTAVGRERHPSATQVAVPVGGSGLATKNGTPSKRVMSKMAARIESHIKDLAFYGENLTEAHGATADDEVAYRENWPIFAKCSLLHKMPTTTTAIADKLKAKGEEKVLMEKERLNSTVSWEHAGRELIRVGRHIALNGAERYALANNKLNIYRKLGWGKELISESRALKKGSDSIRRWGEGIVRIGSAIAYDADYLFE